MYLIFVQNWKIKKIKNRFTKNEWQTYNHIFRHHQMKMIFSKIVLKFNPEIDDKFLYRAEKSLINAPKNENMFLNVFELLKNKTKSQIDWKSFGKFMWYIYQTSRFWYEFYSLKNKNIFTKSNFVSLNKIKRAWYNKWLSSLDPQIDNLNEKITFVLNKVL